MKKSLLPLISLCLLTSTLTHGQYEPPDCGAVEQILIEQYYVSDSNDATDEDGGELVEGSTTWRIYIDLKEDYVLETVYGSNANPLRIETTTEWFNNEDRGVVFGDELDASRLGDNTVALDSYLTFSAASDEHLAVLKEDDDDGQIVAGSENDGGSEGIDGGLLVNDDAAVGIPLTTADGLIEGTIISASTGEESAVNSNGFEAPMFDDENSSDPLIVTNGFWAVLGGIAGPTDDNRILIAQLTTTGEVSLELNFRVRIPEELQCTAFNCHENMDFVFMKTSEQEVPSIENDAVCDLLEPVFLSTEDPTFAEEGFLLFPNPADNLVSITLSPNRTGLSSYRIFDIYGRIVDAGNLLSRGSGVSNIDVSNLASGTYLLQVENDGEKAVERFIKD